MRFNSTLNPSMLAKFVTLFVTLTALVGTASELEVSPQGRLSRETGAFTAYSAKDLEDHLLDIDTLLSPLAIPRETQITVGGRFSESAFDRNTFKLYVGMKSDLNNIVVLSHEYGHAILEKNLVQNSEAFRQFKPLTTTLTKDRLAKKPGYDRTQKIYFITSALHEFFADVVAVTYHKNPQILAELTRDPKKTPVVGSWEDLVLRDFEVGAEPARRENWETLLPFAAFAGEVYYVLLPSRWEFWSLVKNQIHDDTYRTTLLPKVYKAVEKVLGEVLAWEDSQLGAKKLDPETMKVLNQKLIVELQTSLK